MMAAAAAVGQAVSSTTTGGFPGPAAITRLPVCMAAVTTAGPPVTQSSATPGWRKSASADAMLGSATVVSASFSPVSRSISRFHICRAKAAIFQAAGWGLKTAVLPAAITLMALLAMVGAEWVAGSTMPTTPHGARSMTHRPEASLRASMRSASTPSTRFTDRSFSILWSRRPMPGLLELAPAELRGVLVAEPPDDRDHAARAPRGSSPGRGAGPAAAASTAASTVAKTPCAEGGRRPGQRRKAAFAGAPAARRRRTTSPRDLGHELLAAVRGEFRERAHGFATSFPSTSTVSTMPTITASIGRLTGRRREPGRAALGEEHALAVARAQAVHGHDRAARGDERPVARDVGLDEQQLGPLQLRVLLRRDDVADHLGQEHGGAPDLTRAAPP